MGGMRDAENPAHPLSHACTPGSLCHGSGQPLLKQVLQKAQTWQVTHRIRIQEQVFRGRDEVGHTELIAVDIGARSGVACSTRMYARRAHQRVLHTSNNYKWYACLQRRQNDAKGLNGGHPLPRTTPSNPIKSFILPKWKKQHSTTKRGVKQCLPQGCSGVTCAREGVVCSTRGWRKETGQS